MGLPLTAAHDPGGAQARNVTNSHGNALLVWMILASGAAGLLCMDPVVALGGLVATSVVAMLRREDESLPLLFCLGYQWLFIVSGVTYRGVYGEYPTALSRDNVDVGVLLLLGALLLLTGGIWTALWLWSRTALWRYRRSMMTGRCQYRVDRLFLWTVVLYAGSWTTTTTSKHIAYSVSQILDALLTFRYVFLFLLFVHTVRSGRHWAFAVAGGLFVMLPSVTGGGSGFSSVLFVLLLAVLTERTSLLVERLSTPRNRRAFIAVCMLGVLLANLAIMWQGAIKSQWRPIARSGELQASRVERIRMFFDVAADSVRHLDWGSSLESLAGRVSGAPVLMTLVWERVPATVPHSDGALTARALKHIAMPRFLFPNKENLGSDSWLVSKYAGLVVAGETEGTSIGLGYLIEFYIDYGVLGMLLAAFAFGFVVASMHRLLLLFAPSVLLYRAASLTILLHGFLSLEGHLAKVLGGMVMAYTVFALLFLFVGKALHCSLLDRPSELFHSERAVRC